MMINYRRALRNARLTGLLVLFISLLTILATSSRAAEVVALGASNVYGFNVERGEDFPSQLEVMLRAKGLNVSVANAGVNGDTTVGMLQRFEGAIDRSTRVVILGEPIINDMRQGIPLAASKSNLKQLAATLESRGLRVVWVPNPTRFEHQPGDIHLTARGYHDLAASMLPRVAAALRK